MGFVPSQYESGVLWTGATNEYPILSGYATSLFKGDPVTWDTNGTIKIGVTSAGCIGVFQGVKYTDAFGNFQFSPFWLASTVTQNAGNAIAVVIDDRNVLYDIQVSTSAGSPGPVAAVSLAQSDMGRNASFALTVNSFNAVAGVTPNPNPAAGNTISGNSGYYLDYNTLATAATLSLKLWRFTPIPGNIAGVNFNNVLVSFNNIISQGGTGTAGAH